MANNSTSGIEKAIEPLVIQELQKREKKAEQERETARASKKILAHLPSTKPDKTHVRNTTFGVTFDQLRSFSVTYPIARACINHRISQITQLAWAIAPTELLDDKDGDKEQREIAKDIKKILKFPQGTRDKTLRSFFSQIIEDLLVLDAVAIEKRYNLGGDIIGWRPFDPATIELMLLPDGSTPQPPQPAFLHRVNGKVISKLNTDDMYYKMMYPRTNSPYGLSPMETLVIIITTALKLQSYNLSYLAEGNIPEGFVELPKDIASSPDQLKEWQEAWDAIFSGDPRYQRKLKFLPEGMKYAPTKKHEDMTFERFEKWLLLNTCFDDQTEVLTENGWKYFANLSKEERVATRSKNGQLEFQTPSEYQSYHYDGEMIKFKSKLVDLLVTPDHGMLTTYNHGEHRGFSEYKREKACDLIGKSGHLAPLTSEWSGSSPDKFVLPAVQYVHGLSNGKKEVRNVDAIEVDVADFMKFLGIFLADGWTKGSAGGRTPGSAHITTGGIKHNTPYLVGIAQKKPKYMDEIELLLNKLPFKWRKEKSGFTTNSIVLWSYLSKLGNVYQKRIPREILFFEKSHLEMLIDWFVKGDGYISPSGQTCLTSVNYDLLGDFQELAQRIGLSASIKKRKNYRNEGERFCSDKQQYLLVLRSSQHTQLRAETSEYQGMVYDVTVPNGTLLVRRGGKSVWTCNCAVFGVSPQDIGFLEDSNKSTSETQWEIGKERGLFPLAQFLKEIIDEMIQEDLGKNDFEFIWTNLNPTNRLEEAKTFQILVNSGAVSIDEWRMGEGYRPIGAPHYISTPIGPIFVKDLVDQSDRGLDPAMPYTQAASPIKAGEASTSAENTAGKPGAGRADTTNPETKRKQIREEATGVKSGNEGRNKAEMQSEIKKWKKAAKNDLRLGREYRNFYTEIIDERTKELINKGLLKAKTTSDINEIFDSVTGENDDSLKKLYAKISDIIRS